MTFAYLIGIMKGFGTYPQLECFHDMAHGPNFMVNVFLKVVEAEGCPGSPVVPVI